MNIIRASSLSDLVDCPARWEAKYIEGIKMPLSPNALLGKAVHASTAFFDDKNKNGEKVTIEDAASIAVDCIKNPNEDVQWGEDNPKEIENIAVALHNMYCTQISPNKDYVAVELLCENLTIPNIDITLTGTVDRVARVDDQYSVVDIKTGKNIVGVDGHVKTQGYAVQLAVYELLVENSTDFKINSPSQIVGLQVAKTDKGRRIGIGFVTGGRTLLFGDGDMPGILVCVETILNKGNFYGNPRSMLCDQKYCPVYKTCKWRI